MTARELTAALGGRWLGSYGMVKCPAHRDKTPSLSISDGADDKLLTCCHAGCTAEAVWSAIQDHGLVERDVYRPSPRRRLRDDPAARSSPRPPPSPEPCPNQDHAIEIWRASRDPIGTVTADYLSHRGITATIPPTIRDHPGLKHGPTGQSLPAMVAAITGPDRKVTAIQRTFLRCDGRGKANVSQPKLCLGAMGAGAVRLGPAGPVLGIAEGIETGLSAAQLFGLPIWCSLSASRLDRLWLPSDAREVHIFADNGTAGHEAAERAAAAHQGQGRRVVLRLPPAQFGDWNDALSAEVAA